MLQGLDDRASADLNKAAELELDDYGLYALRALLRQSKGDLYRAIADWDKAIQLQPNLAMAYANRGLAYRDTGELDRAISDWGKPLNCSPKALRNSPAANPLATEPLPTAPFPLTIGRILSSLLHALRD
jgi:tetratricopeptide (TPR) repeat protein